MGEHHSCRRWTDEELDALQALARCGTHDTEIALRLNRTRSSVQLMRLSMSITRTRGGARNTTAQRLEAWEKWERQAPACPGDRHAAMVATTLMLRDAKRAGLRPLTSLAMVGDGHATLPTFVSYFDGSVCGSQGWSCAMEG